MGLEQALRRAPTSSRDATMAKSVADIAVPPKYSFAELSILAPQSGLSPQDKEFLATLRNHAGSFIGYPHAFNATYYPHNFVKLHPELAKRPTWVQSVAFLEGKVWPHPTVAAYSFTDKPEHDTFLI